MAEYTVQLEAGRDPDGDVNLEIYVSSGDLLSISCSPKGHMNWAGMFDGKSAHGVVQDALGVAIYALLNAYLPKEA